MTTYAKDLEAVVTGQDWDIPFLDRLGESFGNVGDALSTLQVADAWTGMTADEAAKAIGDLGKRILRVHNKIGEIRYLLNAANRAKATASNAEAHLPGSWIPDWVHDNVRDGASVFWPPLGEIAAENAIQAISDVLDKGREDKALDALVALRTSLAELALTAVRLRTDIVDTIPISGTPHPDWPTGTGGDTGYNPGDFGGGDLGGGGGDDGGGGPVGPGTWRPPYDYVWPEIGPPENPPLPDPDPGSHTTGPTPTRLSVDGSTHGSSSGFGGGAGGIGGGLGAGAGALAAAKLGSSGLTGGGAGSGADSGLAGAGAGGKNGGSMMHGGGGGGQGGGGGEKDKRGSLGLVAPKLEDDEPAAPRSASAGAGGRE